MSLWSSPSAHPLKHSFGICLGCSFSYGWFIVVSKAVNVEGHYVLKIYNELWGLQIHCLVLLHNIQNKYVSQKNIEERRMLNMAAAWLTHVLTHESYRYYKYIILLHMSSLKYLECEGEVDKSSRKWQPLREMLMMCVHIALWTMVECTQPKHVCKTWCYCAKLCKHTQAAIIPGQ